MFNKKFYSITGSLLVLVSLISLCFFVGTNNYKYAYGDEDSPIMIFNRSKNRFKEGTSTSTDLYSDYASAKTELGNDISFSYENFYMAKTSQSYWQLISANGSFTNFDQLSGLKTIDISLSSGSKDFTIYYSKDSITDITSSDVISYSYSGTDARVIFDFNNDEPNYFKFVNTGDSNFYITEMTLTYSCKDIYPLLSIYYSSSFGSVTGEGRHKVGSSVTVTATPKAGATFIGWYIWEDELISKEQTYTFDMYEEPITLYARFSANKYKINLICEDDGGTVTGGGTYDYYSNVEIQAFPKEGYGFKGWYDGDKLVSSNAEYSFLMPYYDLTYTAKFAQFFHLFLNVNDSKMGTISEEGDYMCDASVTVNATPFSGYEFVGWYDINGNFISAKQWNTFTMPQCDYYLQANFRLEIKIKSTINIGFYPQTEITEYKLILALNEKAGTLPSESSFAAWTDYEYYIKDQKTSFMWYQDVTYNNEKYRGVYFNQYRPFTLFKEGSLNCSYQDDNGYYINEIYWFKFEPIEFRILSADDKILLASTKIVDSQHYSYYDSSASSPSATVKVDYQGNTGTAYPNNYKYSDLRTFLNTTFLNTAFDNLTIEEIPITEVDNSYESFNNQTDNEYLCENTYDKIFALSYRDCIRFSFLDYMLGVTDYAWCMGLGFLKNYGKKYTWYWLRTPSEFAASSYSREVVNDRSRTEHTNYICDGVRPALNITRSFYEHNI